ncbi:hypothetical protein G7K_1300-t1 [Saitoella complicata NRRL Y-17804]|uniref:Uncharacterized protein n=1 Tax=Saitoella complicata (strain BCRC 22490 / CBS 7301 / JCM 7358 / NBRC 10748 / NRRL Y-17804) TaxID=698492 RepID=A0A0E9NBA7_SAICN|nr:hypothetical protein G7K_1300-t1 [Saitoella complicata NRRL Y-17804]
MGAAWDTVLFDQPLNGTERSTAPVLPKQAFKQGEFGATFEGTNGHGVPRAVRTCPTRPVLLDKTDYDRCLSRLHHSCPLGSRTNLTRQNWLHVLLPKRAPATDSRHLKTTESRSTAEKSSQNNWQGFPMKFASEHHYLPSSSSQ